jgi:DNA-directed RNA polymerase specialized sigma24 family protein
MAGAQSVESNPDAALVAAAREEPPAFLALYDRYFERVLGYVRLRISDAATCEDVTSTVFTTALAQLPRFRGDGSFAGWLFQIARNAVRDVQRRPTHETLSFDHEPIGAEPDLEEGLLARERATQLHGSTNGRTCVPGAASRCASHSDRQPSRPPWSRWRSSR